MFHSIQTLTIQDMHLEFYTDEYECMQGERFPCHKSHLSVPVKYCICMSPH